MADKKAQLIIEGAAPVELPILTGTVGPDVIDVRGLTATGRFGPADLVLDRSDI